MQRYRPKVGHDSSFKTARGSEYLGSRPDSGHHHMVTTCHSLVTCPAPNGHNTHYCNYWLIHKVGRSGWQQTVLSYQMSG